MYILGAFVLYGKQFVSLWVGGELGVEGSNTAWILALMIMGAYTLPLVQGFGNSILEAKNKLSFKAVLYLSFLIIGTIVGAFLAKPYGPIGMMSGSILGWVIVQNVMNFYYHKVIGLNIIRFFKELLNKTALSLLIIMLLGYGINYIPGAGWLSFLAKAVSYSIVFASIMYWLGCIEFEKQLFKDALKPLLKKIKRT
jgi:hypothetical protein